MKDPELDLTLARETFEKYIDRPEEHECFTLSFPKGQASFSPSPENELALTATAPEAQLSHSRWTYLTSVARGIDASVKIPLDPRLKNLCNWSIRVNADKGVINVNKDFLVQAMRFFVYLDTLMNVLKRTRKLLLKL